MGTVLPEPGLGTDCDQLRQDLASLERTRALWVAKLAAAQGPDVAGGEQDRIRQIIALIDEEIAAMRIQLNECLSGGSSVPQPPPFRLDPWELMSPYGIQMDEKPEKWWTGSIWRVLPTGGGKLLLGTESGGLWLSEPDGSGGYNATCLSDSWPYAGIASIVADPSDDRRIFVGCAGGGLFVSDASSGSFTAAWTAIAVPSWMSQVDLLAMVILPESRLLVVGTGNGLAWSSIDAGLVAWNGQQGINVNDLANLAADEFAIVSDQVLSIANLRGGAYTASPVAVDQVGWRKAPTWLEPLRVASCATVPSTVYCAGHYQYSKTEVVPGTTTTLFVIRSEDNGATWQECQYGGNLGTTAAGKPTPLADAIGWNQDDAKTRRGIAVHPRIAELIAIGALWPAISTDSGDSWDTSGYTGGHSDIHEIVFDADEDRIYVPSDGGLETVSAWAGASPERDTIRNKNLPIVMLYEPFNWRTFYGNLSVSDDVGFIVAGSQDNANLWCSPGDPWRPPPPPQNADGGPVAVAQAGGRSLLIHAVQGGKAVSAIWEQGAWQGQGIIPIRLSESAVDKDGLTPYLRPLTSAEPVLTSVTKEESIGSRRVLLQSGPLPVLALGWDFDGDANGDGNVVYGAIDNPFTAQVEWVTLATIPPWEQISAVEPHSASEVLVGTSSGRVFIVKTGATPQVGSGSIFFPMQEIEFPPNGVSGPVGGIAAAGELVVAFRGQPFQILYVRDSAGGSFRRLPDATFPPNGRQAKFGGIAANRNPLFNRLSCALVVRESELWVSNSPIASVWHKAMDGLPTAVQTADVAFANSTLQGELFLSTYGRGVWKATF